MTKKLIKAICKEVNENIDLAQAANFGGVKAEYEGKAAGLRRSLELAGADFYVDSWGKCFID